MAGFTTREVWALVHGVGWGGVFLLSFAGGFAGLWLLRYPWVRTAGAAKLVQRLSVATWIMAIGLWLTVLSGTYVVFPWYRAEPPAGTTDLAAFPRAYLESDAELARWHSVAAVWKEHVGWLSPILATAVAYVTRHYGLQLADERMIRRGLMALLTLAFVAATIAGLIGALITKLAPVR
jgi:hypothetical protein